MPVKINTSRGFSLVEMIVVIVVLSLGLTGLTLVMTESVEQSPKALVQTRAIELAQTYLDEILMKRYDEQTGQGGLPRCDSTDNNAQNCTNALGNEEGNDRNLFDDVDDYHGVNDSPPVSATATDLTIYSSYQVQVSVAYAGNEIGLGSNRAAKRITVSVTTPLGNSIPISAYRGNF